jgi:hypothetical protein
MNVEQSAAHKYPKEWAMDGKPLNNHRTVNVQRNAFISCANWQASQHEWVKVSDRLPKFSDGDADGLVDVARWSSYEKRWVRCAAMHWANLEMCPDFIWCKRNTNFPEPPKTEI